MLCFIILRNIFSIGAKNAPLRTELSDIKLKGQYTIRVLIPESVKLIPVVSC